MDNLIEITVEVDAKLLAQVQGLCSEWGISVEQLIIGFLKFCACPDNHEIVREWLGSRKAD